MKEIEQLKRKIQIIAKDDKLQYLVELANIYIKVSDYREALKYIEQALELSREQSNKIYISRCLHTIGFIHKKMNNYRKALKFYEESLQLSRVLEDKRTSAADYNNIGIVFKEMGDYEKALSFYFKSLKLREEIGDEDDMANVINNIGIVYNLSGDTDKALEYFNRSLKLRMKSGIEDQIAASYNNLGNLYLKIKEFDKALVNYSKSLDLKRAIGDKEGLAITLNNIGVIHKILKDYDKALEYHKESLHLKEEIGDESGIISTLINISNIYLALKQYEFAFSFVDRALKLARKYRKKRMIMECYETYSQLYSKKREYKSALDYSRKFMTLKESIMSQETRNKIAEMRTRHELESKEKEAEIYKLKNIELDKANKDISQKNTELEYHREHLKLINRILRHDLMNKLAVARSSLNIYLDTPGDEYIDESLQAINQSIDLIRKMKDLEIFIASHQDLKMFELTEVINTVMSEFPRLDYTIEGKGRVLADDTIESVFVNLVSNAVLHGKADHLDFIISHRNNWCEIRVSDNGSGIPREIHELIFEESFRFGETGNTGLGLFIVRKAVEKYGGSIFVESNSTNGASFVMTLRKVK
ncbi:MAG: tetratricopeptide repeat-containing sensor histidine kinase [Candidatus Cloacimonetes bacterium]|nr:tetratricopeptide repeat-containing sensor histidine kinase [Candidatus Cloacimonadota bacterium]